MSELIDNRAHRIRTLKEIIKSLHAGTATEEAKSKLEVLVKEVDSSEIAAMEQELISDGMPVEEVQSMCDAHAAILRNALVEPPEPDLEAGHPVETFRRENEALEKEAAGMRATLEELAVLADSGSVGDRIDRMRSSLDKLMEVEKHYQRKENLVFSVLERHGITGPSKVMWGKDDEVRDHFRALGEALGEKEATTAEWKIVAEEIAGPALHALDEMIYKEQKILIPMCLGAFTDQEWGEIWEQSPEYGWCLVEPRAEYAPPAPVEPEPIDLTAEGDIVGDLSFPSGNLTFEQLKRIFTHLPVDITFVDADDRVRFFSEGPDRVFARSPAIIGRKVEQCHPPKSVGVVKQIVEDFRSGRQNVAEFWIELQGKFIHIRYFAVRDEKKRYTGTLEVTQDVTRCRELEGERRLLHYETVA
jgi:DUF438 domain-containing protein